MNDIAPDVPSAYATLRGDAAVSAVTDRLRTLVSESLGTDVAPDDPLMESGLDSVAGVELQQRAEQEFGVKLEPTAALDHPTPAALGRHVADVMGLTRERDVGFGVYAAGLAASSAPAGGYGAAVTITAPVATYASGVNETFDFWRELASLGDDPQTETPLSRYDADLHYHPTTVGEIGVVTVRHAAYLHADAHERFDADRLRVSAAEALHLDPQQRLLLESCARATTDPSAAAFDRDRAGAYVGCMYNEAPHLQRVHGVDAGAHAGTGSGAAFMCGRVSYCLGLSGPCVSTDTACSSSLVAAHLARRAVGAGDADAGLAAGVNLALLYVNTSVICAIGALSPVGRCKTLDAAADGYGRGEGCGVFVVGGAIDDGGDADSGFGSRDVFVVVASAVNQDGRSSALTAPHGPSQQTLLADVAREERANAAEETRDDASRFVAMHGTGTGLGDPIETAALSRRSSANVAARSKRVDETRQHVFDATPRLVLNAPKAHYGHTEGAAGVAGLLAAAGHLARGESAPARHLRVVNPFVASALDAAGFFAPGAPRGRIAAPTRDATNAAVAGTSSFGMSGVNAHAVAIRRGRSGSRRTFRFDIGGRRDEIRDDAIRRARRFAYFPKPHPLLGAWRRALDVAEDVFVVPSDDARLSFVRDHTVMGTALFPAAAVVSAFAATSRDAETGDPERFVVVAGTTFAAPLALTGYSRAEARTRIQIRRARDEVRLVNAATGTAHAAGRLTRATSPGRRSGTSPIVFPARVGSVFGNRVDRRVENRVEHRVENRVARARLHAPRREPGWVDVETVDASLHLVASIAADASNVAREGSTPSVRVPASMDACGFETADADAFSARRRDAAAGFSPRARSHDGRSETSDHALLASARSRVSVRGLLVKSAGPRAVAVATSPDVNASRSFANQVAARTRHVVTWRATPGDARGTVSFDNILESSRRFVSALPRSTRPFTSASVVADVAAAVASAADVASSSTSSAFAVATKGGSIGGGSPFAAPDAPRGVDASARAGALHAVARTVAQEVPGVNGYATDAAAAEASKAKASKANRVRRAATDADAETTSPEITSSETTSPLPKYSPPLGVDSARLASARRRRSPRSSLAAIARAARRWNRSTSHPAPSPLASSASSSSRATSSAASRRREETVPRIRSARSSASSRRREAFTPSGIASSGSVSVR